MAFICVTPHAWGKSDDEATAIRRAKNEHGSNLREYLVYEVDGPASEYGFEAASGWFSITRTGREKPKVIALKRFNRAKNGRWVQAPEEAVT